MKRLLMIVGIVPLLAAAQGKGISFLHDMNWGGIKQKAVAEHKYIFVDCYASWCGPCKMMDNEVYDQDTVGKFMNDRFLSIKVQMDSTSNDIEEIRNWYGMSKEIERQYNVDAYPSFLFFSPDGQIVHKDVGGRATAAFLKMAAAALDPQQQDYRLLLTDDPADTNYARKGSLALMAMQIGLDSIGRRLAKDFFAKYLERIPEEQLWTKDNIELINEYIASIKYQSRLFRLFYKDRKEIDSIMDREGYSKRPIYYTITHQELGPLLKTSVENGREPDWKAITKQISKEYDRYLVAEVMLASRVNFYHDKKDWKQYATYTILSCEFYHDKFTNDPLYLNNRAFEIFKYSKDKRQLEKALYWADRAIAMHTASNDDQAELIDTRANLLYKLGRPQEALATEQKSLSLAPDAKDLQQNLEKMKLGLPTWKIY